MSVYGVWMHEYTTTVSIYMDECIRTTRIIPHIKATRGSLRRYIKIVKKNPDIFIPFHLGQSMTFNVIHHIQEDDDER